jgi:hypothetical protein
MAQQRRNERCRCSSGREVKHCCEVRRERSEAELAKAFLHQRARAAALALDTRSDDEVVALLDAAALLPRQDVSMQLPLPGLLSPALERLGGAVADDDPDEVAAAVPAVLAEVDTPIVRAGLVRAVQVLRDAGRVSDSVAAAVVVVEQASRSSELLKASLLAAVAVSVGGGHHAGWAAGGQPLVSRPSPFAVSLTASQRRCWRAGCAGRPPNNVRWCGPGSCWPTPTASRTSRSRGGWGWRSHRVEVAQALCRRGAWNTRRWGGRPCWRGAAAGAGRQGRARPAHRRPDGQRDLDLHARLLAVPRHARLPWKGRHHRARTTTQLPPALWRGCGVSQTTDKCRCQWRIR